MPKKFRLLQDTAKLFRIDHSSGHRTWMTRRFQIITSVVILILCAIGVVIHYAVQESLTNNLRETLNTVLHADVEALRIWIENEKSSANSLTREPHLKADVQGLIDLASQYSDPHQGLLDSTQLASIRGIHQTVMNPRRHPHFVVVSPLGLILAANQDYTVGLNLSPAGTALISRVFQGELFMFKPHRQSQLLLTQDGSPDPYWMGVMAPIHNADGRIIAALILAIRPEWDFSRILSIARLGKSGDTYAFDENGAMLSDSRHTDQLKQLGLLPSHGDARSILHIHLRDPGGDLRTGFKPDSPLKARPLTKLIASSISYRRQAQFVLEPYRDYRGVPVVGAAQWLADHDLGIATEVELDEALAPLRPLQLASYGLFAALLAVAAAIIYDSFIIQNLRRHFHDFEKLGQYTLEEKIGEGGMGKVYLARHAFLKRPTAVKFLPEDLVKPETITRFEREVQLTSRLTHPNTVQIYDYGRTREGIFYYAMEYLPGFTLTRVMELESTLPPARVIHILKQICASLEEAHSIGLIHRDIKPLNIMLCRWGLRADVVKILDFGLVKDLGSEDDPQITRANVILGTPGYFAPERLYQPDELDARADLYGVGAVAFNLLTGRDVFEEQDTTKILVKLIETPAQAPSQLVDHPIPDGLDQLVVDCLAKEPDARPQSATEIIARLERTQETVEKWSQDEAIKWWDFHTSVDGEIAAYLKLSADETQVNNKIK